MRISKFVVTMALIISTFSVFAEVTSYTITDLGAFSDNNDYEMAVNDSGQVMGHFDTVDGNIHVFIIDKGGNRIDLGTLGGANSTGTGFNNNGQVAGFSQTVEGIYHAFVTDSTGNMFDLGTLLDSKQSFAMAINESGQVAGGTSNINNKAHHAFVTDSDGNMVDLGTLGGSWSWGADINDRGQVTGQSGTDYGQQRAFVTDSDGNMIDLGTLGTGDVSVVSSSGMVINNRGQVAGTLISTKGTPYNFVTDDYDDIDIFDRTGASGYDVLRSINSAGQVVGTLIGGYGAADRAFVTYREGAYGNVFLLYTLGGRDNYAAAINDNGEVVGWSQKFEFGDRNHAFIADSNMRRFDLNGLVSNLSNNWQYLEVAYDISNTGYITGFGTTKNGERHAYLLTPSALTPIEPESPGLSVSTNDLNVTLSWSTVKGAKGYKLYYAPYPYNPEIDRINSVDLGDTTTYSASLWQGAAFYVAISAYNLAGESEYSNIEQFSLR